MSSQRFSYRIALLGGCYLLVSACGQASNGEAVGRTTASPSPVTSAPTPEASASSMANGPQSAILSNKPVGDRPSGSIFGELGGDFDSGCLWLQTPAGDRTQIRLIGEFEVSWKPALKIYREGVEHAAVGQKGGFGAGGAGVPGVAGCPVAGSVRAAY